MNLSADEENVLRVVQARYCDYLRRRASECGPHAAMVLEMAERWARLSCWDFTRQVGFGHDAWRFVRFGQPLSRPGGPTRNSLADLLSDIA